MKQPLSIDELLRDSWLLVVALRNGDVAEEGEALYQRGVELVEQTRQRLAGQGIAELPDFMAAEYLKTGQLIHLLDEWSMTQGGLYFVTPTARSRPLKVKVLSDFFVKHLSHPEWG